MAKMVGGCPVAKLHAVYRYMLSADQQEQIIRANNAAFENLALRWRNPQTGETQPELRQAVVNMLCDYFSAPGYDNDISKIFSPLYDATQDDGRNELQLTLENQIPDKARAALKRLRPNEVLDALTWDWDECEWDWELAVRDTQEDIDCGYIAIVPLKDGGRFEHRVKPPPSHTEWAIRFVTVCSAFANIAIPDIFVRGTLGEVKRRLDMLLGANTPEIPSNWQDID